MRATRWAGLAAFLLVSLLPPPCHARDKVILKNGNSFTGRIVAEDAATLQVQVTPEMVMTFQKKDVAQVARNIAEPPEEQRAETQPPSAEQADDAEKRQEQRLQEAEVYKAGADVLRLVRSAREAATGRRFREALEALDKARQAAAKALPPAKVKEVEKEVQAVLENARVVLDIRITELYISPDYVESVLEEKRKKMKQEGERWNRDAQQELIQEVTNGIYAGMAQQIAAHLSTGLQKIGYIPVDPKDLKGQRSSVLRVAYGELALSGPISPWWTPMPVPIDYYGMGMQVECNLDLLGPNGDSLWSKKILFATPTTGTWDLAVRQAAMGVFFQQLDTLTFGAEE